MTMSPIDEINIGSGMDWYFQATSPYLNQCWPRSVSLFHNEFIKIDLLRVKFMSEYDVFVFKWMKFGKCIELYYMYSTLYYIRLWTKPGETVVPLQPGDNLSSFPNIGFNWSFILSHFISSYLLGTGMGIMANCTLKARLECTPFEHIKTC